MQILQVLSENQNVSNKYLTRGSATIMNAGILIIKNLINTIRRFSEDMFLVKKYKIKRIGISPIINPAKIIKIKIDFKLVMSIDFPKMVYL